MIIYNVTIKVMPGIADEYLNWLKSEHVHDMLDTGMFSNYRISKLLEPVDEEGITFVVQYHADSLENYQTYINEHSQRMRQKGLDQFGNRFVAFRTVMELID